jgi:hypothetical protein
MIHAATEITTGMIWTNGRYFGGTIGANVLTKMRICSTSLAKEGIGYLHGGSGRHGYRRQWSAKDRERS